MPRILDTKVDEWRTADSKARAAATALTHRLFARGVDAAATASLAGEAKVLRKLADEKLTQVIQAIRPKA